MVMILGFLNALAIYVIAGNHIYYFNILITSILISNVLWMPAIFRYSCSMFLFMFVEFDPIKKAHPMSGYAL